MLPGNHDMHELGITRSVVAIVAEHAGRRRVKTVTLEIGALAGVMGDAVRFCFDIVTKGTVVEGAALDIRTIEARAACRSCGRQFAPRTLFQPCPCGSRDIARLAGEELKIKQFEFAESEEAPNSA